MQRAECAWKQVFHLNGKEGMRVKRLGSGDVFLRVALFVAIGILVVRGAIGSAKVVLPPLVGNSIAVQIGMK